MFDFTILVMVKTQFPNTNWRCLKEITLLAKKYQLQEIKHKRHLTLSRPAGHIHGPAEIPDDFAKQI
jgi:hypothetical protein